jgi:tRNA (guanine37-N1)-methyltransferase
MKAIVLTLFPEMFPGTLAHSLAGKALEKGLWSLETMQIRDFATDKHKTVDDKSYGGGTGLVMKADVLGRAIDAARAKLPDATLIYLTPRGVPFTQALAAELVNSSLRSAVGDNVTRDDGGIIILCGRYEGIDQRILDVYQPLEISLGDYVLSGGEIAAQVLLDACIRLIPGVISKEEALDSESFNSSGDFAGLLEYPQYTAPPSWLDREVPEILRSGNHQAVANWRLEQAKAVTKSRRPDLWERYMKNKKE